MLTTIRSRWQEVLHGLWFVPGLVAGGFVLFAFAMLAIDRVVGGTGGFDYAFGGTASAARDILATIAGSVITVAGLAFSITIITLQLVAGNFSPRATRTFLGNRQTQVAAGIFLGIFLYCILVLRAVRDESEDFGVTGFVPGLAVAVAIVLGVVGLGTLLFFINHIAQSIKVSEITARVARETLSSIDDLYPQPFGHAAEEEGDLAAAWYDEDDDPVLVYPTRPGFVQRVNLDRLAEDIPRDVERMHVIVHPGEFVTEAQPLVAFWPGSCPRKPLERATRAAVVVNSERDVGEDVAFGIQQLADIALRALSPSVNDPGTAVNAVGYLGACLERLAGREYPSARREYEGGRLEVITARPEFEGYAVAAFADVGASASGHPRVVAVLLTMLARAAAVATDCDAEDRARSVVRLAERVAGPALEDARTETDREIVEEALAEVERACGDVRPGAFRIAPAGEPLAQARTRLDRSPLE